MNEQVDDLPADGQTLATSEWPNCPLCGSQGEIRYRGLRDRKWFAPGEWMYRACAACQILWLDPRPAPECFDLIYPPGYQTHEAPRDLFRPGAGLLAGFRFETKLEVLRLAYGYSVKSSSSLARAAAALAARVPAFRDRVGCGIRFVPVGEGTLLDVGCGNGEYLLTMSKLGWTVRGIEPDKTAASFARSCGLEVNGEPFESVRLEPDSLGAITLHHVIEHLPDPVGAVEKLSAALRPGGVLVSISPNPAGLLARCFQEAWCELDPPRHFVLLGPRALAEVARRAGLQPAIWTMARMSEWVTRDSIALLRGGKRPRPWVSRAIASACGALLTFSPQSGEEIVLVAQKKRS